MPDQPVPAPAAPTVDPLIASMLDATNRLIGPDGSFKDKTSAPAVIPPPERAKRQMTPAELTDYVPPTEPVAAPIPAVVPPVVPPVVPAVVPAAPAPVKVKPPTPPPVPQPVIVQPPPPAPVAIVPAADPDADLISKLDEDQKDEYEIAKFAENVSPALKGKAKETLDYFRKVDAFITSHPDATPDSDEFKDFVADNRPKYSPRERRMVEGQMIQSKASAQAKAELKGQLERQEREIHTLKVQPKIDAELSGFNHLLSTSIMLPEGVDGTGKEVATAIATKGYTEAAKEFSVEAPIIAQHQQTAAEYLRIANAVVPFDRNNATHKWLDTFVQNQGRILASQPEAAKLRNGRTFLPLNEYAQLANTNPTKAAQHWTFDDNDILSILAMNAHCQVSAELKKLEASGFKREKKVPQSENIRNPAAPIQDPPPNTRSTPTPSPGPSTPTVAKSENSAMIEALAGRDTAKRIAV